jgi:hypothetical protein
MTIRALRQCPSRPLVFAVVTLAAVLGPARRELLASWFHECQAAAPEVNKPGFAPGAVIPFDVGDSPGGTPFPKHDIDCVTRAFDAWTSANRQSGLAVAFVRGRGGITVRFDNVSGLALRRKQGGGWSDPVRGPDGFLERALIWISANRRLVDSCEGITKVVLHELGHLHGLADNPAFRGPSVMNRVARKNDSGGWIPLRPTVCDARRALHASREAPVLLLRAALEP